MLSDKEVTRLADKVLGEALHGKGYERVIVRSGRDHDDEPALFVEAILKENTDVITGQTSASALGALRNALLQRDEIRFPYLLFVHPDDKYPDDPASEDGPEGTRQSDG
jgi:hypothetical protein